MTKQVIILVLGGAGYILIELLWRGRTHPTMFFAGGISFLLVHTVSFVFKNSSILTKAIISGMSITVVELIFGVVFNLLFDFGVWDYSSQPFNFLGQICPLFTVAWCFASFVFIPLERFLNRLIDKKLLANRKNNV